MVKLCCGGGIAGAYLFVSRIAMYDWVGDGDNDIVRSGIVSIEMEGEKKRIVSLQQGAEGRAKSLDSKRRGVW